ncbi:MAG: class I SAM-dependent methyltransferase [Ilumatobacter sp.]|uniref:class I SAM-dependent methyltransferase n=2 Tax=Ilumatobacter sp. TaxID=1967498 RepID=UPI003297C253
MSVPAESIFFDLWSATYDRAGLQQSTYRPVHDAVLARLDGLRPERVLDLGCGTGQLTRRLGEKFPEATIVGADLSDGMLGRALERAEADDAFTNVGGFVRADAQRLPLADGSFDVVTCTESFHWYRDQEAAVAELARLLRPGGRLVIASIATVTGFADDAIQRATELAGRPIRPIPKRRLKKLLEADRFRVEHQGRIPRLGFVPWPMLTDATRR